MTQTIRLTIINNGSPWIIMVNHHYKPLLNSYKISCEQTSGAAQSDHHGITSSAPGAPAPPVLAVLQAQVHGQPSVVLASRRLRRLTEDLVPGRSDGSTNEEK